MKHAVDFACPACKVVPGRSCEPRTTAERDELRGSHKSRMALAWEANGTLLDPRGRR